MTPERLIAFLKYRGIELSLNNKKGITITVDLGHLDFSLLNKVKANAVDMYPILKKIDDELEAELEKYINPPSGPTKPFDPTEDIPF